MLENHPSLQTPEGEVNPDAEQNIPAGQGVQEEKIVGTKVPAGHAAQAAEELLPVDGLYVPAGHAAQAAEELLPVDGLYVPAC